MQGEDTPPIPYGYCHCGCGRKTTISTRTVGAQGIRRGEPRRYVKGHQPNGQTPDLGRYRVDGDTGCWAWQGALTAQGYGAARFDGKYTAAHRAVWLDSGRSIPDGHHLHHTCRNRACVNPDHLVVIDGEEHATLHARENATLTAADAREIRARAASGFESATVIAADYGVASSTVTAILRGEMWADANAEPIRDRRIGYKLDDEDRAAIRRRAADGESQGSLAREYGVSQSRISTIVSGKRYSRKGRAISPCSEAQREKVRLAPCIVCGAEGVHPAHLIDKSLVPDHTGDPRRVVPLCPPHHREYDDGALSLLEHLEPHYRTELACAVETIGLIAALERLTNQRWAPDERRAA